EYVNVMVSDRNVISVPPSLGRIVVIARDMTFVPASVSVQLPLGLLISVLRFIVKTGWVPGSRGGCGMVNDVNSPAVGTAPKPPSSNARPASWPGRPPDQGTTV